MLSSKLRGLFHYEFPNEGGAPSVPGAGEAVPSTPQPPTSPDTSVPNAGDAVPGPIPYARFKEVNDARRALEEQYQPYAELEELGYPVADLQRLTAWEQEYVQDPVGAWLRQAEEIANMPDAVKAAIQSYQESAGSAPKANPADGTPPPASATLTPDEEPPEWARPLIEDREARVQREQEEAISSFYDGMVAAWQQLDETQGLVTPEEAIHAHLAAASPQAGSAEELLRTARETWLAVRESTLGAAIKPPGRTGTVPQPVPGSVGASGGAPPVRPRTLREATQLAASDPQIAGGR